MLSFSANTFSIRSWLIHCRGCGGEQGRVTWQRKGRYPSVFLILSGDDTRATTSCDELPPLLVQPPLPRTVRGLLPFSVFRTTYH